MNPLWIRVLVPGLLLGFTVSRLGFTDYAELHRMLVFRDLRLLWAFAVAVGLLIVSFAVLRRRLNLAPVRFHSGILPGAVAFGVGWAVTGACPGVVLAQLGQGTAPAVVSFVGILLGSAIAARVTRKPAPPSSGC